MATHQYPLFYTLLTFLNIFLAGCADFSGTVSTKTTGTATTEYGLMFADVNHSGDGGIYAQLLRNNGFQGIAPGLAAYEAVGGTTLSVAQNVPLSSAIKKTLSVTVPADTTGQVGFSNSGFWGIPANEATYRTGVHIKGTYSGDVTIQLVGASSGTVYGKSTVNVDSKAGSWNWIETNLDVSQAPDGNNLWTLTFDGSAVAGNSLWFSLPQLYPPTYKDRPNGLKQDLAQALIDLKPTFLRFPGGNNLEGNSEDTRWKWNETIGPLRNRPGRRGNWGYPNTDGLGLHEYCQWCEDMELTPILVVWAGLSILSGGNTPITGDALEPYVDDVINELEYVLGSPDSEWGAVRASHGHSEPFNLQHVQIGNEDNLSGGCSTYPSRFTSFYDRIHAAYPDLTIITSTSDPSCLPNPVPDGVWLDYHEYSVPDTFVANFHEFDDVSRDHPYLIGEYSQWRPEWPTMKGAVAEAVFTMGCERNSDVIKMAARAPLFGLIGHQNTRAPDTIYFNHDPNGIVYTTSFYVQQLFATYRGDALLSIDTDTEYGPVYWVAAQNGNSVIVKLANFGEDEKTVDLGISGKSEAKLIYITGTETQMNTIDDQSIKPQTVDVTASDGRFSFSVPKWSVGVLVAE